MSSEFVPADTSREAYDLQAEVYRRMGGPARAALVFQLNQLACSATKAGIRARHPDYDEDQVRRAFLRIRLGEDLIRKIWPSQDLVDP
jgi:hypothetical protein